jgi:hypothetical protein
MEHSRLVADARVSMQNAVVAFKLRRPSAAVRANLA